MSVPIVYYHRDVTWESFPARQRYLMEAMSAHTRVIYLNPPRFKGSLLEAPRPSLGPQEGNVTVVQDAFGFRSSRLGRRLGQLAAIDASWLHTLFRKLGVRDYVYWLSTPAPALLQGMRANRLVFDCIDPCFLPEMQEQFDREEAIVARQAKVVFCTAEVLLEKMRALNASSFLVPNACSPDEYLPAETAGLPVPEYLKDRKGPIVGSMGSLDWRIDAELLTRAAARLPQVTFVLAGRINRDQEERLRTLRALPNVILPGSVPVAEGRALTAAFHVGLIPYLPGPMNDAVNSVKMYMYLAAGKPVVSTDLRECRRHSQWVMAAASVDEFVAAICAALHEDSPEKAEERIQFALRNRWEDRAAEAFHRLQEAGLTEDRSRIA